jgi:hypothetical protein
MSEKKEIKSPNINKMVGVVIDDRTTVYFKPGTPIEKINRKVELYKKSLEKSTVNIVISHDHEL